MSHLAHLATKVFNTPLAIHPRKVDVIMAALAERFGVISLDNFSPRPGALVGYDDGPGDFTEAQEPHCYEVVNGVAMIPICGTLVNKLGALHPLSGMTGYDGIRQNFLVALEDPAVKGIAFDIESPGGEVGGCFDLADLIYEMRSVKPSIAILSEYAYSAAYALASSASMVVVPRTGGVGSVGTIWIHADLSKALKNAGVKITMIHYGERKTDAHAEIPLSKPAFDAVQADINTMGGMFVDLVARNRGMTREAVIATQAGCYMGQDAVNIGFADEVLAPDEAFRTFVETIES